jgi:hypothetical protein
LQTYSSLPQHDVEEDYDWAETELDIQQADADNFPSDGRYRNRMGVEIMPLILEEEEDEDISTAIRRSLRQVRNLPRILFHLFNVP